MAKKKGTSEVSARERRRQRRVRNQIWAYIAVGVLVAGLGAGAFFGIRFVTEEIESRRHAEAMAEQMAAMEAEEAEQEEEPEEEETEEVEEYTVSRYTENGEEMARKLDGLIETWVEYVGKGLSEQDRAAFYHGLDIISNNLREGAENLTTTKGE